MKNYTKKELQSMSDWNLVQIYCDEMGGIDENDLMIEVRGNKEERENLISQLLQRMKSKYKEGGGILDVHSKVLDYLAKNKFSISTFGRHNNNNIKVEDKNFGIEDQIKIEKIHPKIIVSGSSNSNTWYIFMPNEFADGGGVIDINELNMPVIRTQFEDEEYEFKDGGGVEEWRKGQTIGYKTKKEAIYRLSLIKNHNESDTEYRNLKVEKTPNTDKFNDKYVVSFEFLKKYKNGGATKGFCYTIGGL